MSYKNTIQELALRILCAKQGNPSACHRKSQNHALKNHLQARWYLKEHADQYHNNTPSEISSP